MTDIQQTAGDRLRFEVILKSLTEGGINLAILSEHDLVLDFYANLVDERLRARGDAEVEFCFSTNSERLVQKFNEILSSLTVDEALDREQTHVKRRYLVFRDSILMQDFELQLLARLVNGFPAGNISVILLINSAGSNRNKLDAFGKSLLQWEVETRAGEPKKPLDDWVTEVPVEPPVVDDVVEPESVQQLLNPPKSPSWRIPGFGGARKAEAEATMEVVRDGMAVAAASVGTGAAAADLPIARADEPELWLARSTPSAPPMPEPAAMTVPVPPTVAASPDAPARPRRLPWGLLLLVPLLSAAAFAFMYRDRLEQEVESFRKYLLRGTPAPVAVVPALPASAASAEAPASEPAPAPLEAPVSAPAAPANVTESAVAPVVAAAVAEPPAAARETPASRDAVAVATAPSTASAPAAVTPAKTKEAVPRPPKEAAASPQVGARTDDAWTGQLAPGDYVVQLAAFDTEEEALAFRRSDPVYAKAHVLRVRKKESDKRYYVLIAGPLTSKAEAQAFMQSSPLLAKGWLRSAKSLQAQR